MLYTVIMAIMIIFPDGTVKEFKKEYQSTIEQCLAKDAPTERKRLGSENPTVDSMLTFCIRKDL